QRPITRQHGFDIGSLIVCITVFAIATGAAHSFIVPLFLIPLVSSALAFGRWWVVLLLATLIAAIGFVLGALTPDIEIGGPEFGVQLLSVLAPSAAVALIIAV